MFINNLFDRYGGYELLNRGVEINARAHEQACARRSYFAAYFAAGGGSSSFAEQDIPRSQFSFFPHLRCLSHPDRLPTDWHSLFIWCIPGIPPNNKTLFHQSLKLIYYITSISLQEIKLTILFFPHFLFKLLQSIKINKQIVELFKQFNIFLIIIFIIIFNRKRQN